MHCISQLGTRDGGPGLVPHPWRFAAPRGMWPLQHSALAGPLEELRPLLSLCVCVSTERYGRLTRSCIPGGNHWPCPFPSPGHAHAPTMGAHASPSSTRTGSPWSPPPSLASRLSTRHSESPRPTATQSSSHHCSSIAARTSLCILPLLGHPLTMWPVFRDPGLGLWASGLPLASMNRHRGASWDLGYSVGYRAVTAAGKHPKIFRPSK